MGITSSALSKAQAAVSKSKAEVDGLEADLATARSRLKWVQTGDTAVDKITEPFADKAGIVRQRTEAAVSSAQADVDEISAKLESAKTKYDLSLKALNALRNLTED